MDYKVEFERLLFFAKQALSGVDIQKREVLGFAGFCVLNDFIKSYDTTNTLSNGTGCRCDLQDTPSAPSDWHAKECLLYDGGEFGNFPSGQSVENLTVLDTSLNITVRICEHGYKRDCPHGCF